MTTDNYWFKEKRYGWGWTPKNWKGWLSLVIYVFAVTLTSLVIRPFGYTLYFLGVGIESVLLIYLCKKKGPPLKQFQDK